MSDITLTSHQGKLAEAMYYLDQARRAIDATEVGANGEWGVERMEVMEICSDALSIIIAEYQEFERRE